MTMNCGFMPICGFAARIFRPSRSTRAADSVCAGRIDVRVTGPAEFGLAAVCVVGGSKVGRGSPDPARDAVPNGSDGTRVVFASSPRQPLIITGIVIRNDKGTRFMLNPRLQ